MNSTTGSSFETIHIPISCSAETKIRSKQVPRRVSRTPENSPRCLRSERIKTWGKFLRHDAEKDKILGFFAHMLEYF